MRALTIRMKSDWCIKTPSSRISWEPIVRGLTSKTSRVVVSTKQSGMSNKKLHLRHWEVKNFHFEEQPYPSIKLRCPGLSHESFDHDSMPKLTSIMLTSALARAVALQHPIPAKTIGDEDNTSDVTQADETFLNFRVLSGDHFIFMSSTEFVMSRSMYDYDVPKWPLDMTFTHGYVGNTSVANVCNFYACKEEDTANVSDSGQSLLWTNTYQIVLIDKTTRKPTQLPDWFKEKYKGKGCMDKGFILRPFPRPAVTFSQSSKVQWSDTDQYKHTNFTTYARWAMDTLHAALRIRDDPRPQSQHKPGDDAQSGINGKYPDQTIDASKALPNITKEILSCGLHKVQITYLKECLEGETVETHVWQEDGAEKELVLFSVVKNNEDVCQIKMWYFPVDDIEEHIP
ncbi:hypothetical protein EGW08_013808 [Elysia chlorotica]|uniref:Uncharacterized protein n=1 Tax=Elysia chlorotica TaxID=188477 RepID=A0A433TAG1_ELYCH|nr:hypothetical protein EGW08_013808 [Elysia chlorotica]